MNNLDKIFDYFKKEYRAGHKLNLFKDGDYYWITQGYVLARVPISIMELNPALCNDVDYSELLGRDKGEVLEDLKLQEVDRSRNLILIPFQGNGFTAWINKKYLDIFPKGVSLRGTGSIDSVWVYSGEEVIGLVCPIRHEKELPTLYDIAK